MKYLLSVIIMMSYLASPVTEMETSVTDEKVEMILELKNGTTIKEVQALSKLEFEIAEKYKDEFNTCTVKFSDGSCSKTAANCEEARRQFNECACSNGHSVLCESDE